MFAKNDQMGLEDFSPIRLRKRSIVKFQPRGPEMQRDYSVYYDQELIRKLLGVGCFGVALKFLTGVILSNAFILGSMGLLTLVMALAIIAQCLLFDTFKLIRFPLQNMFADRSRGVVLGDSERQCYVVFAVVLVNYVAATIWVASMSAVLTVVSPWIVALCLSPGVCILSLFALKKSFPVTDSIFNLMIILLVALMLF